MEKVEGDGKYVGNYLGTKGAADRIIRKAIMARLRIGTNIEEVWLYEKGRKRLFYKNGIFR